jgi:hypothetical protein
MSNIKLLEAVLDGKTIAYSSETEFHVQVGKGAKGSYKRSYSLKGNLGQAVMYYNGINIGNCYKKRLVMWDSSKVLAREVSFSCITKSGCSYNW